MKRYMKMGALPKNPDLIKNYDLICFSHLRWDFVFQRPQHLMSRFARDRRVFFIEEPMFHGSPAELKISKREDQLHIVTPFLPHGTGEQTADNSIKRWLEMLMAQHGISKYVVWYYTPMMLGWSEHLEPLAVVYDCMDQLSAFKNAPKELITREAELFSIADLVFTGGPSLYEAKREQHSAVYCFPSSIDAAHFATARQISTDPDDQAHIPHPRIGFFGVIDERSDLELLANVSDARPDWHFVMIGPVVKIDESELPRAANIHYLGGKDYKDLPKYISGWDVAMMPFALNDSTRFISPTKTPEYLAAGLPVVSTPIRDVVRPYGEAGLVHIAETPNEFAAAIERAMKEEAGSRHKLVGEFLEDMSWDKTYRSMSELIDYAVASQPHRASAAAV